MSGSRLAKVEAEVQATLDLEQEVRDLLWRCLLRDEFDNGRHPAWLDAMTQWLEIHDRLEELGTLEDRLLDDRLGRVWAGGTH